VRSGKPTRGALSRDPGRDVPVATITRERILSAALQLFNANGVAQVSTNRIAAEIGISPGNLYYHFKNKEQIVERLFGQFELELGPLSEAYQEVRAIDDVWLMFHLVFEVLDRYRFAYHDIDFLVREYPKVRHRAAVVTKVSLRSAQALCTHLADLGVITASPGDAEVLAFHVVMMNRSPFGGRHEATVSVIHGRPVRSLATNREPAVGG
jgi:AcrR family transcriptional regulator